MAINDNFNDHFEDDGRDAQAAPVETPEEREEREIRAATIERRHDKLRIIMSLLCLVLVAILAIWVWVHYFRPYSVSQEQGVIEQVAFEGTLFRTYEGKMMSQRMFDSLPIYNTDFAFSMVSDSVAAQAKRLVGHKVTVDYQTYKGLVPWRGATRVVVTRVTEGYATLPRSVAENDSAQAAATGKKAKKD